jgi:HAD superfamily hydrolase (TIGR01509 family)
MVKAIFWDNDGVLVETEGLFFKANQDVLAEVGVSLQWRQFEEISLNRGGSVLQLAAQPKTEAFYHLRQKRDRRYADFLARENLVIDGVRETLEAIKGRYVMGIVTSSSREHFEIIHRQSQLLPYFQFALTLQDCTRFKPHPEPYLKAVSQSGFPPEDCLVIEDSPRGLASAVAAGLRCVVIPSRFTRRCSFVGAYAILESIKDLPSLLGRL